MAVPALRPTRIPTGALTLGISVLVVAMVLGIVLGPVRIAPGAALREIVARLPLLGVDSVLSDREAAIVWQLRVPRVVLGALVGAMLAVAGGAYQGVFRNPLADPYLLGIASGAGLGATLAITYGRGSGLPLDVVPLAAFLGAVLAVAATYAIGRAAGRRTGPSLILAGVAVGFFFTAVQIYVQQREVEAIREVYAWILGRLAVLGWDEVRLVTPYILVASVVLLLHRRLLDVLSVGDEEADTLGIRSDRVRGVVVLAATLGTAAAVSVSGLIGFVGIVVPHAVRLMAGSSYRIILPLSLVGGAAFLILADLAARTLLAPAELPIGVVTAFVGAPFFAVVLRTARRARP